MVEFASTQAGGEVVLKDRRGRLLRLVVKELLLSGRDHVISEGTRQACTASDGGADHATGVLG